MHYRDLGPGCDRSPAKHHRRSKLVPGSGPRMRGRSPPGRSWTGSAGAFRRSSCLNGGAEPRTKDELDAQEALLPARMAAAFEFAEATLAADMYVRLGRPRRREI